MNLQWHYIRLDAIESYLITMNKLVHHGIQLQVQLETHEVYLKPKIETYMIWGNIILDLAKHTVIQGPIELEFSGTCHTLWPQGTWLH